jgi:hypothetical protein
MGSPALDSIKAGYPTLAKSTFLARLYITRYEPIKDASGNHRRYFVGYKK